MTAGKLMWPLKRLDAVLDSLTMYKLLVFGLGGLAIVSVLLCFTGVLPLSGVGMLISFVTLVLVCDGSNRLLGRFWPAVTNVESAVITGLILGCILPQATSLGRWLAIVAAGLAAMASKYLLAHYQKHVFNPAAIAAVILGVSGVLPATWWVGTPVLLPVLLVFVALVVRKLRRFGLFASFIVIALAVGLVVNHGQPVNETLWQAVGSSPLLFLGGIMLTEPLTTPPAGRQQLLYAGLVGLLYATQLRLGHVAITPELALVLGNVYSYAVSLKKSYTLRFKRRVQLSPRVYDYVFAANGPLAFQPGQYMEWTIPGRHADIRGNRRSFSIASSPGEAEVHLGIAIAERSSSFKSYLASMQPGDGLVAGHVNGHFTLPTNTKQKLVFVAGGIGITPFRSMVQDMLDTHTKRDIVLFYMVKTPEELSYHEVFERAEEYGLRLVPVLSADIKPPQSWRGESGRLTTELLKKYAPDYPERRFYLSGPSGLVTNYSQLLRQAGVRRKDIIRDYFAGY